MVVSIHDVAPHTFDEVRYLVDQLDALGATPRVFKVIPQHLEASPQLIAFLQREQALGSEIVLHGYAHRRSGSWQRPWRRQLRAQLFAPHDAEFLSLTPVEIESRLVSGRAIIEGAGLALHGFCAPGWIESGEVRRALLRTGFRYDLAMTHMVDLHNGRRIWMDWVGYMGAGGMQEDLVGIANSINRSVMPLFNCTKLFLHPQQARTAGSARRILHWLGRLMRERSLATYVGLLSAGA